MSIGSDYGDERDPYDDGDGIQFADPGGKSAAEPLSSLEDGGTVRHLARLDLGLTFSVVDPNADEFFENGPICCCCGRTEVACDAAQSAREEEEN